MFVLISGGFFSWRIFLFPPVFTLFRDVWHILFLFFVAFFMENKNQVVCGFSMNFPSFQQIVFSHVIPFFWCVENCQHGCYCIVVVRILAVAPSFLLFVRSRCFFSSNRNLCLLGNRLQQMKRVSTNKQQGKCSVFSFEENEFLFALDVCAFVHNLCSIFLHSSASFARSVTRTTSRRFSSHFLAIMGRCSFCML